jgi:hypothetical protein
MSFVYQVPEGEDQPTTDVDLFISTERIKVVNSINKVTINIQTEKNPSL